MSSLLEQAIIDATALKEAALKNAEAQVLEKYSTDVKEALRSLLEQEEGFTEPSATEATGAATSPVGMGGDQAMGGGANVRSQAPSAFRDGQKLCACPEDKEQVTIEERKLKFAETLKPFVEKYGREFLNDFYLYWTEPTQDNKQLNFELQKTWSLDRRLSTWLKQAKKFGTTLPKNEQNKFWL